MCKKCDRETVLITEEVQSTLREGKYLSCSHCGSKRLVKELVTDDLREIMKARSYKRNRHGALEQVR